MDTVPMRKKHAPPATRDLVDRVIALEKALELLRQELDALKGGTVR